MNAQRVAVLVASELGSDYSLYATIDGWTTLVSRGSVVGSGVSEAVLVGVADLGVCVSWRVVAPDAVATHLVELPSDGHAMLLGFRPTTSEPAGQVMVP